MYHLQVILIVVQWAVSTVHVMGILVTYVTLVAQQPTSLPQSQSPLHACIIDSIELLSITGLMTGKQH